MKRFQPRWNLLNRWQPQCCYFLRFMCNFGISQPLCRSLSRKSLEHLIWRENTCLHIVLSLAFPVIIPQEQWCTRALTCKVKTRRHSLLMEHLCGWDPLAEKAIMAWHFNQWKSLNTGRFYSWLSAVQWGWQPAPDVEKRDQRGTKEFQSCLTTIL